MDSIVVADLKITRRKTGYSRGQDGYEQILYASLDLMIEEGYKAITFRRIAKACNMNVGSVTYYFKTKEALLRELLEGIIGSYIDEFDRILETTKRGPVRKLEKYVTVVVNDLAKKKTTRIFPELWALANHDPFINELVQDLYSRVRVHLHKIIEDLNPNLTELDRETVALFLSASLEGLTMFAGHNKPWEKQLPALKNIAIISFVTLIRTITSESIAADPESRSVVLIDNKT